MWRNALTLRLLVLAAFWSIGVLVIAGIALTAAYRETVENDFADRLEFALLTLVATSEFDESANLGRQPELADPAYNAALSGWYWQIAETGSGRILARSRSLVGEQLTMHDVGRVSFNANFRRWAVIDAPRGEAVTAIEQRLLAGQDEIEISFVLAGSRQSLENAIAEFRDQLIIYLAIFGAGLIVITIGLVTWAMLPLRRIRTAVSRVVSGQSEALEGNFPSEISPLVGEINALIGANRRTVERARTLAGNLAHALKTPLSVLRNEAGKQKGPFGRQVRDQIATMDHQVNYHLERARMAAQSRVIGAATLVEPSLSSIARAMGRIYADRNIKLTVTCAETIWFRGEKQDLEEILGNLVDNAHKWARYAVSVSVVSSDSDVGFRLTVEDDGPGLAPDERAQALKRGMRLDETTPGTGLGLAIVDELVTLYGGALELLDSDLGGLRIQVELPGLVRDKIPLTSK